MKKNKKTIVPPHEQGQKQVNYFTGLNNLTNNEGHPGNGLWMEFEDSYIRILSAGDTGKTVSNSIENRQLTC